MGKSICYYYVNKLIFFYIERLRINMEVGSVASKIAAPQEFKPDNPKENKVDLTVNLVEDLVYPVKSVNAEPYILNISDEAKALNIENGEVSEEITAYDPGGGHPKRPTKKTG